MKLESQVASLELSKRLKELGVKQDGAFWWCRAVRKKSYRIILGKPDRYAEKFSAFTVAELGNILKHTDLPFFEAHTKRWSTIHRDGTINLSADTEADARAKTLVYLLEKGIVKS